MCSLQEVEDLVAADVLERLPTQPASRIDELLPPRWQITAAAS